MIQRYSACVSGYTLQKSIKSANGPINVWGLLLPIIDPLAMAQGSSLLHPAGTSRFQVHPRKLQSCISTGEFKLAHILYEIAKVNDE